MRNARPIFAVFLALLGLSACGSDSIPIGDLGAKLLDESCTRAARCGEYPDKATCLASNSRIVDLGQLEADVSAGKVTYDGSKAADCLSAIFARGCTITEQLAPVSSQACDDTFKGSVATGGTCFSEEGVCLAELRQKQLRDRPHVLRGHVQPSGRRFDRQRWKLPARRVRLRQRNVLQTRSDRLERYLYAPGGHGSAVHHARRGVRGWKYLQYRSRDRKWHLRQGPCRRRAVPGNGFCDASSDTCDATSRTCVRKIAIGGGCPSGSGCVSCANCDTATLTCVPRASRGGACTTTSDCLGSLTCTNGVCVDAARRPRVHVGPDSRPHRQTRILGGGAA